MRIGEEGYEKYYERETLLPDVCVVGRMKSILSTAAARIFGARESKTRAVFAQASLRLIVPSLGKIFGDEDEKTKNGNAKK